MNAIPKTVALACFFIGFGLSLGCLVYSALSLWRIHKRRMADLDKHRLFDYHDPNWVICDCCGRLVRREEVENRYRQKQKEIAVALKILNQLPPTNPRELEKVVCKMTEQKKGTECPTGPSQV